SKLDNSGSLLSFATLSSDPSGSADDDLPLEQERIGSIRLATGDIPLIAVRTSPRDVPPYWQVSAASIKKMTEEAPAVEKPAITSVMPAALNDIHILGAPLADWLV